MKDYEQHVFFEQDRENMGKYIDLGKEIIYLTKNECENIGLSQDDILDIVTKTLVAHGKKDYEMPAKIGIHPWTEVFFHAMPAYVPELRSLGCKWIECFPQNPKKYNLPQTTGLLILNDVLSGGLHMVNSNAYPGGYRSGSGSPSSKGRILRYVRMWRAGTQPRTFCHKNNEESEKDLCI